MTIDKDGINERKCSFLFWAVETAKDSLLRSCSSQALMTSSKMRSRMRLSELGTSRRSWVRPLSPTDAAPLKRSWHCLVFGRDFCRWIGEFDYEWDRGKKEESKRVDGAKCRWPRKNLKAIWEEGMCVIGWDCIGARRTMGCKCMK